MPYTNDLVPGDRATPVRRLNLPADDEAAFRSMIPQAVTGERDRPLAPPIGGPPHRRGAVLVLLYPVDGDWHLPLTVRTAALRRHSGEVSLPGGRYDESDGTLDQTALREAWEELGIVPAEVEIVGRLMPVWIPVSNFLILPVVGLATKPPTFTPASAEVAEVVEVSLQMLSLPTTRQLVHRIIRGVDCAVPCFVVAGHEVWGATAIILAQLLNRLHLQA
ncbi:MAG: CoA pyrophosphatase [Herpetosiphonaceae bacterium]|nr:CoA pyrophosphatase [Herpetosiphonaceae bacterium]